MLTSKQEETELSGETIWILGGGKFGRRAAKLLTRTTSAPNIVMIEQEPVLDLPPDIELVCADGVEWFAEQFVPDSLVRKIIPAIPIHLAVEWLKQRLLSEGFVLRSLEIPEKLSRQFPHPIRIDSSKIVMSHADFICPENCAEPDKLCSYTQQLRPPPLYNLLRAIDDRDFTPLIVRSRQFASGVGGFYPEDLWNLLTRARLYPGVPLLVGTACKCHGVVDAFSYSDT